MGEHKCRTHPKANKTERSNRPRADRDRERERVSERAERGEDCLFVCELILKQTHVRRPADTCINCYDPRAERTGEWLPRSNVESLFVLDDEDISRLQAFPAYVATSNKAKGSTWP